MTLYESLSTVAGIGGLLVAVVGIVLAGISLSRTRKLDSQQSQLQAKQVELTDLQLEFIKRQAAQAGVDAAAPTADVRVTLEGFSDHRFVITNWGEAPAADVQFEVLVPEGGTSPLVSGDADVKLPIPVLAAGAQCSLLAALSFDTGVVFDVSWRWTNPDGAQESRQSRLTT